MLSLRSWLVDAGRMLLCMLGQVFPPMGKVWSTQNTDNVMNSSGRGRLKSGEEFLCLNLSCLALKSEFLSHTGDPWAHGKPQAKPCVCLAPRRDPGEGTLGLCSYKVFSSFWDREFTHIRKVSKISQNTEKEAHAGVWGSLLLCCRYPRIGVN